MNRKMQILLGLPKTIYFNFKCFDFGTAMKLPVLLAWNTKIGDIHKGVIQLENFEKNPYHITIGIGGSEHVPQNDRTYISFGKHARIRFMGGVFLVPDAESDAIMDF